MSQFLSQYTLADVMNSIRESASPDYQDRIPVLNDQNFREFATGVSIPVFFNEWHSALINRIGLTVLKNKSWENPLAFLKKGQLEMGETVQEIYVGLIDAVKWESFSSLDDAGKVWKTVKPDVHSAYHVINREDLYEISYNQKQINRAFVSPRALQDFILGIYERLYTSDQLDEYLYMKELLKAYDEKGLFHYVSLSPTTTSDQLLIQVKAMSNDFTFLSDKYTGLAVPQFSMKKDQVLIMNSMLHATIDVTSLATAFNMDKKEFQSRVVVIDDLGIEDGVMVLIDRDWYMVYDSVRQMESIGNPRTLEIKYFYHVHQVISTSMFENAVLFTTRDLVDPVSVTASLDGVVGDVNKGQWYTLDHSVLDKDEVTTDVNQAVGYLLSGAVSDTKIEDGRLYVSLRQNDDFTVRVYALHNKDVYVDVEVTVA